MSVAVRTGVMGIFKPPDTEWDEAKSTNEPEKQCNEDRNTIRNESFFSPLS